MSPIPDSDALFLQATRQKIRFSYKGECTVEALWDIPLTDLDKIYQDLSGQASKETRPSLMAKTSSVDSLTLLKIELIKAVYQIRHQEIQAKEALLFAKQQAQTLDKLIEKKKTAQIEDLPIKQLEAMRASLTV